MAEPLCTPVHHLISSELTTQPLGRTICADVVALDQTLIYNRFGSFNPFGMMFALRRDVVPARIAPERVTADECDGSTGTERGAERLTPGEVRLRDCKRPRPLVLRANVGDVLHLRLTNMLRPEVPDFSSDFCDAPARFPEALSQGVSRGSSGELAHDEVTCRAPAESPSPGADSAEWPRTRSVNFAIQGLTAFGLVRERETEADPACLGLTAILPGASVDCYYKILREGPYFLASTAAPSGGEGDGGSITHGLFGSVMAEKQGTSWYRSQVSAAAMQAAMKAATAGALLDYEAKDSKGRPVLQMLRDTGKGGFELFHNDLNAIVVNPERPPSEDDSTAPPRAFREFAVFFHDELKSFYTGNFDELGAFGAGQLAGVRDGFAINYGASGMGTMLLANRKGIGPAANCAECLYEEFFLSSWSNGDPALLESYADDPSNVHHSYLNDAVVFRNFHAGPKETHVFHLHAHQWFGGNDANRGAFLDSQTVGPQQAFSYDISGGGLEVYRRGTNGARGWFETLGSGNRNRTVGDSIFHCHLYPHFAQGMWELWRVHDVFEDGSRKLPDGQWHPGFSLKEEEQAIRARARPGSVDPATGRRIVPAAGSASQLGTPIPALVPLPHQALPLAPTYPAATASLSDTGRVTAEPVAEVTTFPGYPFYIPGSPGHRPPQAPMDLARALDNNKVTASYLDGGLPRHVLGDASTRKPDFAVPELPDLASNRKQRERLQSQIVAKALALGDMTMHFESAEVKLLDYDGTPLEKAAMAFHHNGRLESGTPLVLATARNAPTGYDETTSGYDAGDGGLFTVNGAPPKPGAPFADPCGAPDALGRLLRQEDGTYLYRLAAGPPVPLRAAAPGEIPGPLAGVPARDTDVTNWGNRLQFEDTTPNQPRRTLFYIAQDGTATVLGREDLVNEEDPFLLGLGLRFTSDPGVTGFRRYEASAVQVGMVTNRAGWHDPQARINVLTSSSDLYKDGAAGQRPGWLSPKISAEEQPFFFRALSGECIEFRHTNELPKDLALDDFQVKTPTDTIGQHIHLVKFDVTSSDGSGNGWNYEDGTFAPDEIAARICAAKNHTGPQAPIVSNRPAGALQIREAQGLCEMKDNHWIVAHKEIWRKPLAKNRDLFQTTVQRWFADPILSQLRHPRDEQVASGPEQADRTLRTVFSHDHFGPSSIQQHGFYTALVLEQQNARICDVDQGTLGVSGACSDLRTDRALRTATAQEVGARKIIRLAGAGRQDNDSAPGDLDVREFALAVADFAMLYDPRDQTSVAGVGADPAQVVAVPEHRMQGMATLYCEARYAHAGRPDQMKERCHSGLQQDGQSWFAPRGDVPPAWLAAGRPGDMADHLMPQTGARQDLFALSPAEIEALRLYFTGYRRMAAGYAKDDQKAPLAQPVAGVKRPESISVDHHDPYLINYRGEPIPLRIGDSSSSSPSTDCTLKDLDYWAARLAAVPDPGSATPVGVTEVCSVDRQKASDKGDMSAAFLSSGAGDPVTPILRTRDGDQVMVRLIQGAQEVQHTFTVEDHLLLRNHDQKFPSAMPELDDISLPLTLSRECQTSLFGAIPVAQARLGRADQYARWFNSGSQAFAGGDADYWRAYDERLARCFNAEGRIAAQEIGISEHFEFSAAYVYDSNASSQMALRVLRAQREQQFNLEQLERQRDLERLFERNPNLREDLPSLDPQLRGPGPTLIPDLPAAEIHPPVDSLLHFGSVDALWNGAWGLLRVEHSEKPDQNRSIAACDPLARRVYVAIAAVETRRVHEYASARGGAFPATTYAPDLSDPDGLFFAILDLRRLTRPDPTPDELKNAALWSAIPLDTVLAAVSEAYSRPEPMVLNVNAGDCVNVTLLNALEAQGRGLADNLGDALMPRITPLNVDIDWGEDDSPDLGPGDNQPLIWSAKRSAQVAPSANLAVNFPLPVTGRLSELARPIGQSSFAALSPTPDNGTLSIRREADLDIVQIQQYEFYAGYAVTRAPAAQLELASVAEPARRYAANLTQAAREARLQIRFESTPLQPLGRVSPVTPLIRPTQLPVEPPPERPDWAADPVREMPDLPALVEKLDLDQQIKLSQRVIESLQQFQRDLNATQTDSALVQSQNKALLDNVNFVPYAFGALPFKSLSDVVGHVTHGLFGAIVVVPRDATIRDGMQRTAVGSDARCQQIAADRGTAAPRAAECQVFILGPAAASTRPPAGVAQMSLGPSSTHRAVTGEAGPRHRIRQFTLFWQDGLNLWDRATRDEHRLNPLLVVLPTQPDLPIQPDLTAVRPRGLEARLTFPRRHWDLVTNCLVCDDTYDWGERGVSYQAEPFHRRLRGDNPGNAPESHYDLNDYDFGTDFFRVRPGEAANPPMPVLRAEPGEEVVIHIVHPGGRARQRAFITIAQDYDDLFPGFGFPRGALLAPGKAVTASLTMPLKRGCYLWFDGPTQTRAGGTWGLLEVATGRDRPCQRS